jgi:hypothetical protein
VFHGSLLTKQDVEGVNVPIAFFQSDPELDRQIPTPLYKEVRLSLGTCRSGAKLLL